MSVADDLYTRLSPLHAGDADRGYPLRALVRALAEMFAGIEAFSGETEDLPPWGASMDAQTTPEEGLGWLGQFHGVSLTGLTTEAQKRTAVESAAGFARGSVAAMKAAAAQHLTSTQRVDLFERNGGNAYALLVVTYLPQTPDQATVLAALKAAKPAGIVLTYECREGQAYAQIEPPRYATYTALGAAYLDYDLLSRDQPV